MPKENAPTLTACEQKTLEPSWTAALATASGRRWLRRAVLPVLEGSRATALANLLLGFRDDFRCEQRDFSTRAVVERADQTTLAANLEWLAGSNAALALWERLAEEGITRLVSAALRVLRRGDTRARELVLTVLVADPTREIVLPPWAERALLVIALADRDEVVRGLAAETAAGRWPELLLPNWQHWTRDGSGRARRATWRLALRVDAHARMQAAALTFAEEEPADVRADALWALGQVLATAEIAPILARVVQHPRPELAEAAAELLWTRHRHPEPARAALASPHPRVREMGKRLLDPRHGSPAAGGSRPGMPFPWW
jgi:hypothetical protein